MILIDKTQAKKIRPNDFKNHQVKIYNKSTVNIQYTSTLSLVVSSLPTYVFIFPTCLIPSSPTLIKLVRSNSINGISTTIKTHSCSTILNNNVHTQLQNSSSLIFTQLYLFQEESINMFIPFFFLHFFSGESQSSLITRLPRLCTINSSATVVFYDPRSYLQFLLGVLTTDKLQA